MTETDLITAGGSSSETEQLQNPVNSDISTQAAQEPSNSTPTAETAPTASPEKDVASGDRAASLTTMVLPELRALAKQIGVEGASGMRKSELVAAIRAHRGEANGASTKAPADTRQADAAPEAPASETTATGSDDRTSGEQSDQQRPRRERRGASREPGAPGGSDQGGGGQDSKSDAEGDQNAKQRTKSEGDKADGDDQQGGQQNRNNQGSDDDGEGRQGRRGRRFRDRRRRERGGEGGGDRDTELREDDVVQPVAGILDVLDNYAFVRTSGYLAGPNDVYVSMNMVRKNGLRRGDAVTGAVRVPKDGEGGGQNPRQKFNPLVRLDTVNGGPVEDAKNRPEFTKLTPLYPNQRLRLETTPEKLTTRVIDLIMPIGKGQRALIVSPPKAGKTTIMQDIANAITKNNPECHLMVVLVDERPEEVTDMQRSVKGEVIASTFDRPPSDHTQAAELAIERAKRLVEQGKDVVVLLDSITRLGRAYNNASPASGRILSGGVDSTALYPPKRFLGAARNIEEGGSLTIIATAMVETGSTGDTVIFEEFKGTGNAELKLDRKIAERRVFPAVDVNPSGTRKDELLLSPDEFAIVHKLRRVLSGLDPHQAIDLLMSQLRKTKNNYEFLVQVSKTAPGNMDVD
ncbi:transcription termination factor Rho [Mycolicibacterium moriokaense]|uniref:Transcription termination factor Rho n=1 Tax=Mycolicibacterium moriokaense TaxID=39691 RepID=A0AAD1M6F0_9MYCO|nr:transcription termination factor Rho [Mycolicibacterium moriokaense]MCV7042725.1 transcription termination factor Rho [Mycolicibacterium moriokaense]ORB16015.1 transcription termination factor Rho [Mycolicibacterium moriokaense]BBX01276.1 transcription termination factor Rho [Mycolicibacterium moriokaense]